MKVKSINTLFLSGIMIGSSLVILPTISHAATKVSTVKSDTSKISKTGRLVSKKTGKSLSGYKIYQGKLYRNGVKFSGVMNKTYYKVGSKATALYKGKYYKKGKLSTGLYKTVYYVKGVAANGVYNKKYYSKGKLGTGLYKNAYYAKGQKATGMYKKLYYVNGELFTGKTDNVQYVKGVNKGAYEIKNHFYLKDYAVIGFEHKLPETVEVKMSNGKFVDRNVTWKMQEENPEGIILNGDTVIGNKEGEYIVVGSIPGSTYKASLKLYIGTYNGIYEKIDRELLILDLVKELINGTAETKNMQVSMQVIVGVSPATGQSTLMLLNGTGQVVPTSGNDAPITLNDLNNRNTNIYPTAQLTVIEVANQQLSDPNGGFWNQLNPSLPVLPNIPGYPDLPAFPQLTPIQRVEQSVANLNSFFNDLASNNNGEEKSDEQKKKEEDALKQLLAAQALRDKMAAQKPSSPVVTPESPPIEEPHEEEGVLQGDEI